VGRGSGFGGLGHEKHGVAAGAGEKTNIKITTPEDWRHAQMLKEYLQ